MSFPLNCTSDSAFDHEAGAGGQGVTLGHQLAVGLYSSQFIGTISSMLWQFH